MCYELNPGQHEQILAEFYQLSPGYAFRVRQLHETAQAVLFATAMEEQRATLGSDPAGTMATPVHGVRGSEPLEPTTKRDVF